MAVRYDLALPPASTLRGCLGDVAAQGWHCVAAEPPYAYTVGLDASYHHAELVVAGLPVGVARSILAAAVRAVARGETVGDGVERYGILQGFPARFRALDPACCTVELGVANLFYDTVDVPLLQLLWPDINGYFPDDPGCDNATAAAQDIGG